MPSGPQPTTTGKLLGGFPFISRTFEGRFKDNPYVLDADANFYVGPADQVARDEHVAIEIIYQFLNQTDRPVRAFRRLFRSRPELLQAFETFDRARDASDGDEFQVFLFGTYDGEPLQPYADDELPSGPCGKSVNEIKRRLYEICSRVDPMFGDRPMTPELQQVEDRFMRWTPETSASILFDT